jgi:hypothetical protein
MADKSWTAFHDKPAGVVSHAVQSASAIGAAGQVQQVTPATISSGDSIRVWDGTLNNPNSVRGYTWIL